MWILRHFDDIPEPVLLIRKYEYTCDQISQYILERKSYTERDSSQNPSKIYLDNHKTNQKWEDCERIEDHFTDETADFTGVLIVANTVCTYSVSHKSGEKLGEEDQYDHDSDSNHQSHEKDPQPWNLSCSEEPWLCSSGLSIRDNSSWLIISSLICLLSKGEAGRENQTYTYA